MPLRWDWTRSNGGASTEQTVRAHTAVSGRGRTYDFSHFVWNDLVENTYSLLVINGGEWNSNILSYEETLIEADGILTAEKFNSLRINIINSGWPWQYNEERPDYIGRYNVHIGDKVFGSYILELAHKYNVMYGILDGTAGDDMSLSGSDDIGIPADLYMICVRGILTALLLDTDVTASLVADLYPLIPSLLELAVRTDAETDTDANCDIVVFGLPEINGKPSADIIRNLTAIAVKTPPRSVTESLFLKTREQLTLDDESSDDMELICTDILGVTSAAIRMTRLRAFSALGAVWRSDVSSRRSFRALVSRCVLTSIANMRSNVATSFGFGISCVTRAVPSEMRQGQSEVMTESEFTGWWCDVEPLRIDRLRSDVTSAAEFILRKSIEILLDGYALSSNVESEFSGSALFSDIINAGTGDFWSGLSGDSTVEIETLTPFVVPQIELSSDVASEIDAVPSTSNAKGARLEPYTNCIASDGVQTMKIEAELRFDGDLNSDVTSGCVFHLSGEFGFMCESGDDICQSSTLVSSGLSLRSGDHTGTYGLTVGSVIVMTTAPPWIYPVQTDDDLFVVQAKEISAAGTGLVIG